MPYNSLIHTEELQMAIDTSTCINKKISLKNPLPILIRYFTAEADSNGLKLYIDIYNKDEPILKMLYPSN
jgi:murein L,D-transpeptidase YcbB/YkuD